ncbi:MAG: ABC transporter permease subunit [Anaerolineae bacterium]
MRTIFRHTLSRHRGQILGWGIALGLLGFYLVLFYDTIAEQQEVIQQLLQSYPPEMLAFFGDIDAVTTPEGYLGVEFFSYMPLILGIFAVLAGSSLLASDEEQGTLDLVLAYPVSRTALFLGRLLGLVVATTAIFAIMWLSFVIATFWSSIGVGWSELVLPFLSLLAVVLLFGTLAILLSMLLPSRRLAAMTAGIVVVASFFLTSLARIDEDLETIAKLSPLNYYQSGDAIQGLNSTWFGGLLAVAALFTLLAWWRFQRRDIRIGGEGGWRLSLPWRKPATGST